VYVTQLLASAFQECLLAECVFGFFNNVYIKDLPTISLPFFLHRSFLVFFPVLHRPHSALGTASRNCFYWLFTFQFGALFLGAVTACSFFGFLLIRKYPNSSPFLLHTSLLSF